MSERDTFVLLQRARATSPPSKRSEGQMQETESVSSVVMKDDLSVILFPPPPSFPPLASKEEI